MLVDSHAHLDDKRFAADLAQVMARAREAGVERIVTVGTDIASCEAAVALAGRNRGTIFAAVGIHPHEAAHADDRAMARLGELARSPGVVAVGEAGLDYHYNDGAPRDAQKAVFEAHIRLALKLNLPIVIHCRDGTLPAYADCLPILERYAVRERKLRGVAHCFSGDRPTAEALLATGFFISFSGTLTFPNAGKLREVAGYLPVDRILVETDCPYLAPQCRRGARNEPAFVKRVVEALAEIRAMSVSDVANATSANAARLFGPEFAAGADPGPIPARGSP